MASSSESLPILKELFPDWSEEDLTLCLEESRGELDTAIARISDGHATKFGEVTKKKEKAPRRVEHGNGRGRGRGASTGAPRGRSDIRGRGRGRGASTSAAPSTRSAVAETTPSWAENVSTPQTEPVPAWAAEDATADLTATTNTTAGKDTAEHAPSTTGTEKPASTQPAPGIGLFSAAKPKSRIVDKNSASSWASIAKPVQPVVQTPADSRNAVPVASKSSNQDLTSGLSVTDKTAPLTEENLEAVTEDQEDLPEPPAGTVASLQGEPATGPSSLTGQSTPAGPPGLKTGSSATNLRGGTPVGGRRLNQNEAVVMPGSERDSGARLGVQFGSLGLGGDDEVYDQRPEAAAPTNTIAGSAQQNSEPVETRHDILGQASRQDKASESYGGYGSQDLQQHHHHQQQQQPSYGGQGQEHYPGMSGFYGQNEQARASPFGAQGDYYQQQALHNHHAPQPPYGSQVGASQRSDTTSRPTEQPSRYGDAVSSPMTSMTSQPNHSASPVPSHMNSQQHHHHQQQQPQGQQQQQQQQAPFPMHPQYGAPNPYAYYGYGYGYPQQQHSGYGAQMYGQQQQRGAYGGGQGQYPTAPASHQPVGTSQDRFERSTAEYQRQQQMNQYPQSGSGFGNTDFLGASRNQQPSSETLDPFKGYNHSQGSTGSRDDNKTATSGFGSQSGGYGQHTPSAGQYGSYSGSSQYGDQQGQQGQQQQQQQQQQGQPPQQNQYSQYGSYGRQGTHQQYGGGGGGGQWNQQY